MVSWNVEVGGTDVEALQTVDITTESGGTLGTAKCQAGNTATNRAIDFSQQAIVTREGVEQFRGPVTRKPSLGRQNGRLEFTVHDQRYGLSLIEVHRPFYQVDPGEIIRRSVNEQARVTGSVRVHEGSDAGPWSASTAHSGLVGADEQGLPNYGDDVFAVGFPEGITGTHTATYDSVPSAAIPGDGQVVSLTTSLLVNNRGGLFEAEVELNDSAGNRYIWPIDRIGTGITEYTFEAQNAQSESYLNPDLAESDSDAGTLTYRFSLTGPAPENRAVAIDHCDVLAYETTSRSGVAVDPSAVLDVGPTVTRRHDETVMEVIEAYATEYQHTSWVDSAQVLHFEPSGSLEAPVSITQAGSPVTNVSFNRDSTEIVNKVTVLGSEDVSVTVTDSSSISYYGVSEREEQVVDRSIQSEAEARRRGEGILEDSAWTDQAITFELAGRPYTDVQVGDAITVDWPAEDISSRVFTVSSVTQGDGGLVNIAVTGSGAE